jgi:signal transduction histidine kinase
MKRNIIVFPVILLFLPLLLCADNSIETLEQQLKRSTLATRERIDVLTRLSELTQDSEPLKAVKYGKEGLEILQQIKLNDPALEVRLLLSLTWASQNVGHYETALEYGHKAETMSLDIGDKRSTAVAYNHFGRVYFQLGFLDRSLEYVLQALKLFEELGDKTNTAEAYKNIGNVYLELENSKQALEHYFKSLHILEELGDKKNYLRILNNIGNVYNESRQYEKALEYYRKTLTIAQQLNWQIGQIVAWANIAGVYSETNVPARSLEINLKTIQIARKIGHKRFIAILLSNIGVDYRKLKQYDKALSYVFDALDIAKEIKNKDIIRNFYEELYYIYDAKRDYKQAFIYLKKYKETHDEMLSAESRKNIADLWLKFKTEKKEKEIKLLTQNNRIQQLKLDRQALIRNFLVVVSILVLILAGVILNRYLTKKKAEGLLKESEKKLRAMNAAKDKLFSIIAHDLESPLNGLILSSSYLEKNVRALKENDLKEFHHQIYENASQMSKMLDNLLQWAVSQLGKLEVEPEVLDLYSLSNDTIALMEPAAAEKNIRLVSHVKGNTLVWADKRMVETIMRNLLSNAVKYSYQKGEVHISSTSGGHFVEVTVADNGTGIPPDKLETLFAPHVHRSADGTAGERGIGLGLVLCKEFVEENGGTIRAESEGFETGTGTRLVFTLPAVPETQYDRLNSELVETEKISGYDEQ